MPRSTCVGMMPYAAYRWKTDMITATAVTNVPRAPRSLLSAPSSCSTYASAFFSASAETWTSSSIEGRVVSPMALWERGRRGAALDLLLFRLIQRDAFFGEVFLRAWMVRNHRGAVALVLQIEVLRLGMHPNQIVLVLEQCFHDVVSELIGQLRVGDQHVPYGDDLRRHLLAGIGLRRDRVLDIQRTVFLDHCVERIGVIDQLQLDSGRGAEIGHRGCRQAADPEERIELLVLDRVG